MKRKSVFNYFLNGFSLANKSLDLFLISLCLTLPLSLNNLLPNPNIGIILTVLSLGILFIYISFMLSLPLFLEQKQKDKSVDYKNMFLIVIKNIKRIIIPGILIFIILALLLLSLSMIRPLRGLEISLFSQNMGINPQISLIIFTVIIAFLEFTSFFFSLEHTSLLRSINKSIHASSKNIYYISIIILINIFSNTLINFISIEIFWGQLIRIILGGYLSLLITSSSLFYYQNIIKRNFSHLA